MRERLLFVPALILTLCPLQAATVAGKVQLVDSQETAVRKRRDYSGVAVWLEPVGLASRPQPRKAEMVQKDKAFTPHVLAITQGSTVDFPNFDPIFHNAFSNFSGQPFDVGLYPPGTRRSVTFRREGVVRVFCNIHPTMSAVILVLKTPYFAVTGPAGVFEIPNVPAGEYQLRVFHERASAARLKALDRKLEVDSTHQLDLEPLVISETGYLHVPHKDKYGHDYPPAAENGGFYPGGRK